ncbi:MAG: divalent-cation tolerance protein CutA [Acaryochloridaceae cyanobacterium SU_2_1]|nr:divalent-cation tolerance protein CutA [Acaryochloridaceae cyanobacterium SU_2_1]
MSDDLGLQYVMVFVTIGSQKEAIVLSKHLVEQQLAACVSLFPVTSVYAWQGKIEQEQEWQLVIKTQQHQFTNLEATVCQYHMYQVPEIIAVPIIAGSQPYLNWISTQMSS